MLATRIGAWTRAVALSLTGTLAAAPSPVVTPPPASYFGRPPPLNSFGFRPTANSWRRTTHLVASGVANPVGIGIAGIGYGGYSA